MHLRLLTFNIRYDIGQDGTEGWRYRRDLVLELVRSQNPDVIAFQEVLPTQRADLEAGLPEYRFLGRGRERDGGGEQCAIAFRPKFELLQEETFWLCPTPEIAGSVGWDAMLTRICTRARFAYENDIFTILNAHFDHHGRAAPAQSAELILRRMDDSQSPYLLLGDFNSLPDSEALAILKTRLRDSFAEHHPRSRAGTYHEFGRLESPTRIDYLMMSPQWQLHDCQILSQSAGPYPSDHFPVLGCFEL